MPLLSKKGPKYTTSDYNPINGEDHLGIRSVGISIADHLQAGITSITPRARYWSFFAWVLHDFIQHAPEEKTLKNFKQFLKRQEWFYILANIGDAEDRGTSTHGVIGSTKGSDLWKQAVDVIEPNLDYVKNSFGGYATYRNVMKIAGITSLGDEGAGVQVDRLTKQTGRALAEAFEETIKGTEYYQDYRLTNRPVPKSIILEYGRKAGLDQLNRSDSRDYPILMDLFLLEDAKSPRQLLRKQSMLYYMTIINQSAGNVLSLNFLQDLMFDGQVLGKLTVAPDLQVVAKGWEIYQARQFFTFSLDTIWSYLLEQMSKRIVNMNTLISNVLTELENDGVNLSEPVDVLFEKVPLLSKSRRTALDEMKSDEKNSQRHIWQPIFVMLDVFQRLQNRQDFNDLHYELLKLGGRDSISLYTWNLLVQSYQNKSIKEFIGYILRYYILEQHQKVALNKMITTGNETYHFIENDGKLYFISEDRPVFNTFRVNQGLSILED